MTLKWKKKLGQYPVQINLDQFLQNIRYLKKIIQVFKSCYSEKLHHIHKFGEERTPKKKKIQTLGLGMQDIKSNYHLTGGGGGINISY